MSSSAPFRSLPRSDGGGGRTSLGKKLGKQLGKVLSLPKSALIDKSAPYFSGVRRFGVSTLSGFYNDPFHTLLNMPWGSFVLLFFSTYLLQYILFAFIYWMQGSCVRVEGTYRDGSPLSSGNTFQWSLWMSSRVSSTLGFTDVRPAPECPFINLCVMIQIIFSSLINFIMLGVVFARFSAPFKRASTVRFSKVATISRHPSGFWAITMRVANLRKHQILHPNIRMVVTAADSITPSFYQYEQLAVEGAYKQLTNLELGFPAHVTHVITPDSFLYNLSLLEMDTRMMEVLVFVDGIDAMTSRHMSARIAYSTSDMYMNEQFSPMNLELRGKRLGLDFSAFDKTLPALDPALLLDLNEAASTSAAGGGQGMGLWQLRHQTFRRLAERYAHLGTHTTAGGENGLATAASGGHSDAGVSSPTAAAAGISSMASVPGEVHHGLLGGAVPSHMHVSASAMAGTLSGMPFAVSKPGEKEPAGLAAFLGMTPKGSTAPSAGGAWVAPHSEAHATPGGSNSEVFVPIPGIQRGVQGNTGTAWQQSSVAMTPLSVPHAGLGGTHATGDGRSHDAAPSPAAGNPLLYTLDEENPAPRGGAPLPASQHASG